MFEPLSPNDFFQRSEHTQHSDTQDYRYREGLPPSVCARGAGIAVHAWCVWRVRESRAREARAEGAARDDGVGGRAGDSRMQKAPCGSRDTDHSTSHVTTLAKKQASRAREGRIGGRLVMQRSSVRFPRVAGTREAGGESAHRTGEPRNSVPLKRRKSRG
eukprot:5729580-Prymnesium_polylepis.1